MMTRQLATLVGAGFPLVTAFDTLIPHSRPKSFKKMMAQIKDSIIEGSSFASALTPHASTFSPVYINMVRAGESSGTLEIVLERLADITEKQQQLNSRIRSALAYPILMAFIGALVLSFLLIYIIPSISSIFTDMGKSLPLPTQILIGISTFLKSYWWIIGVFVICLTAGIRIFQQTQKGRLASDKLMLALPVIGALRRKLAVARLSKTLGSLLENGVTMMSALGIVRNIVGNILLAQAISRASEDVEKGRSLGDALSETRVFPNLFIQMIQVGEQSGELEPMLAKIADVYENEVQSSVTSLTALLEPVMILVMATLVGFIVLSICLPIFEMNELIR